jgi:hypothetical protein
MRLQLTARVDGDLSTDPDEVESGMYSDDVIEGDNEDIDESDSGPGNAASGKRMREDSVPRSDLLISTDVARTRGHSIRRQDPRSTPRAFSQGRSSSFPNPKRSRLWENGVGP